MVDLSGLEPKQTESKSVVLPLHHRSKVDAGDSNPVHDKMSCRNQYYTLSLLY